VKEVGLLVGAIDDRGPVARPREKGDADAVTGETARRAGRREAGVKLEDMDVTPGREGAADAGRKRQVAPVRGEGGARVDAQRLCPRDEPGLTPETGRVDAGGFGLACRRGAGRRQPLAVGRPRVIQPGTEIAESTVRPEGETGGSSPRCPCPGFAADVLTKAICRPSGTSWGPHPAPDLW
jgi:hypothetical protein